MGSLSPFHWIIVIVVVLLLFGAKKIPELAKGLGQGLREFKKSMKEDEKEPAAPVKDLEKDLGMEKTENKDAPKV